MLEAGQFFCKVFAFFRGKNFEGAEILYPASLGSGAILLVDFLFHYCAAVVI